MSCAVFTFFGFYTGIANKPRAWLVATNAALAFAMLVLAFYQAWRDERISRKRLERDGGPNILLRIGKEKEGAGQPLEIINDGTETAIDVQFTEESSEPVRILLLPWNVPYVRIGEPQRIVASCYSGIDKSPRDHASLRDVLLGDEDGKVLSVIFQNSQGTRFTRRFTIKCPILTHETHCFPGIREVLPEERKPRESRFRLPFRVFRRR